jgi:hypothetical protein
VSSKRLAVISLQKLRFGLKPKPDTQTLTPETRNLKPSDDPSLVPRHSPLDPHIAPKYNSGGLFFFANFSLVLPESMCEIVTNLTLR